MGKSSFTKNKSSTQENNHNFESKNSSSTHIENEIMSTLHPFEKVNLCSTLSPVQKAITYVMETNNGWATEDEILSFLNKHWSFIMSNTSHKYRQGPDKRMLHINFSITKERQPLFIRNHVNPEKWGLPPMDSIVKINSNNHIGSGRHSIVLSSNDYHRFNFESSLLKTLENFPEGRTLEQLLTIQEASKNVEGVFKSLSYERRIRAALIVLKSEGKIKYHENGSIWTIVNSQIKQKPIPPPIHNQSPKFPINSLTVNELYDTVNNISNPFLSSQ